MSSGFDMSCLFESKSKLRSMFTSWWSASEIVAKIKGKGIEKEISMKLLRPYFGSEEGKAKSEFFCSITTVPSFSPCNDMDIINELSDDLLVKILSFVPTKVAVSTSVLSKRWEFLWMWLPKLEYSDYEDIIDIHLSESSCLRYRDFINKNLPLHRAPIIDSLRLCFCAASFQPEDIKLLVGIAISLFVRELELSFCCDVVLPSSLYTCKSLVALKLIGIEVLVDVPRAVCLPSLKTLQLRRVRYFNEDSLGLLLSCCPVLEDLVIERHRDDNVKGLVVIVPSLQRLSLSIDSLCSSDGYVMLIDTPSLKYFKVVDYRGSLSYSIQHMPELEEADVSVYKGLKEFLKSITSVKCLSLKVFMNTEEESICRSGIVFDQLEHLKLTTYKRDLKNDQRVVVFDNSYLLWNKTRVPLKKLI